MFGAVAEQLSARLRAAGLITARNKYIWPKGKFSGSGCYCMTLNVRKHTVNIGETHHVGAKIE